MPSAPVEVIVISDDEDCKDRLPDIDATHTPEGGADEMRSNRVPEFSGSQNVGYLHHSDRTRFDGIAKSEHVRLHCIQCLMCACANHCRAQEVDNPIVYKFESLSGSVDVKERLSPSSSRLDFRSHSVAALVSLAKVQERSLHSGRAILSTCEDLSKNHGLQVNRVQQLRPEGTMLTLPSGFFAPGQLDSRFLYNATFPPPGLLCRPCNQLSTYSAAGR